MIDSVTFTKDVDVSQFTDLKREDLLCGRLKIISLQGVKKRDPETKKYKLIKGRG